jgi:hypothetical protein
MTVCATYIFRIFNKIHNRSELLNLFPSLSRKDLKNSLFGVLLDTKLTRCVQNQMRRTKYLQYGARYRGGVKTDILETAILSLTAFERARLRSAV